jgi:hypothetical protein
VAHAQFVGNNMGNGRLDLLMALAALPAGGNSPEFSVSAAPSTATITAGEEINFTVSGAPVDGFNHTLNWTCIGAPAEATCTVLPSAMILDGSNVGNSTVRFTTAARASSMLPVLPRLAPPMQFWRMLTVCFAWPLIALVLWNLRRVSERRLWPGAAALLLASAFCVSCGTGCGKSPAPPPNQGTPAGTYTLTLTASSGNLSHVTTVKVIVN